MTYYLASYDVETIRCLEGVESIVRHHKAYNISATFFVVGELLEDREWARELKKLIDDPLFDIQCHTYSHLQLKFGPEADNEFLNTLNREISSTNKLIYEQLGRSVMGFRTPMGFSNGLRGECGILKVLWDNGIRYVSSKAVGKHGTVPAPFASPFYYDEEDILHPILEIPVHGWHDNILKGYNFCPVMWPPIYSWGYPGHAPETPKEEFAVNEQWLNQAIQSSQSTFAPVFHPWAVRRFDQNAGTIELILQNLIEKKVPTLTYSNLYYKIREKKPV